MRRKLLAMDLDGTACADDYSMSKSSVDAIRRAQEAGHVVAFVSGRRDVDMLSLGEEQWEVGYHILNGGGKIIRCSDRAILYNKTIDSDASRRLIEYCVAEDLQLHIVDGYDWLVTKMTQGTMEYAQELNYIPKVFKTPEEVNWKNPEGFMATADWEPVARFMDENVPEMIYVHSEPGTIDIMARGITKWGGICALADLVGIPYEDTIAVGNYYNDMDMIERAGTGIAVANSLEPVKEIADYVTKEDNNHDAVKEIVDMILAGVWD